ncbi:xylulokinase, partial [Ralstonia pseudosolanacearum]
ALGIAAPLEVHGRLEAPADNVDAVLAVGGDPDTVLAKPPVCAEYAPNAARHAALCERLVAFRELYRHVQPLYEPSRPRLA